jgi:hypothetical protein
MTAASKRLEQEPVAESDEEWIIRQDFLFIDLNPMSAQCSPAPGEIRWIRLRREDERCASQLP